ncbi:hypothetical protein [uncultured Parabacteroides sp.]|uniref:hypothetical protein n=1 Tax=uncultured Parabacteroides sp. TaxID=512312 RepID=UPI00259B750E|nr:hypothetical protein [uncultured Parabacteroides sp.]
MCQNRTVRQGGVVRFDVSEPSDSPGWSRSVRYISPCVLAVYGKQSLSLSLPDGYRPV